jgi:predicted TIM-barrel enzyme
MSINIGSINPTNSTVNIAETMETVNNTIQAMPTVTTAEAELRSKLENTVSEINKLIELLNDDKSKECVSTQLKEFVDEAAKAAKKEPLKGTLDVSSHGLLEAAKAVASLTAPITTAVQSVLSLLAL